MVEGFTRSQAAGHPRQGEPSVTEARSTARSLGQRLRDFLTEPAESRRSRQAVRRVERETVQPPREFQDRFAPLPPDELLPPEQRGFVTGPSFTDQFQQKAYDFGLIDDDGNVVDKYGLDLLRIGWYDFQRYDFDDVVWTRETFFDHLGVSWRDFDDWREYISEYLGAA